MNTTQSISIPHLLLALRNPQVRQVIVDIVRKELPPVDAVAGPMGPAGPMSMERYQELKQQVKSELRRTQ